MADIEATPTPARRIAVLVIAQALIAMTACLYGFAFAVPAIWTGTVMRGATILFIAGLAGCVRLTLSAATWRAKAEVPPALAMVLCLVELALTLFFNLPTRWAIAAILLIWSLCGIVARYRGAGSAVGCAMACGFILFIGAIVAIPIDVTRADMLPVISHAIDVFHFGGDPYSADFSAITNNPFFYPPMQWLIFLPARIAGIDLRLVNLASAAAIVALVEWRALGTDASLRAGVYPVLLSPLTFPIIHSGQVWPYWLALAVFACSILAQRWAWSAVVMALAIGLRPTALIVAAAVFCALPGRIRLRAWLWAATAGAASLLITTVPFLHSFDALAMLATEGPRRALVQAHLQGNPESQIALSNWWDWLGFAGWDARIEAGLGLLTVLLTRHALRFGTPAMLTAAGLGYMLTISSNPYLHGYYYIGGLLLAGIGLTSNGKAVDRKLGIGVA